MSCSETTMLGLVCHQGLGEHGKWDWEGLACFVLFVCSPPGQR